MTSVQIWVTDSCLHVLGCVDVHAYPYLLLLLVILSINDKTEDGGKGKKGRGE